MRPERPQRMNTARCPNYNHYRTNPPLRGCPMCGEIVNAEVQAIECGDEEHRRRKQDGDLFCTHCARPLSSSAPHLC